MRDDNKHGGQGREDSCASQEYRRFTANEGGKVDEKPGMLAHR